MTATITQDTYSWLTDLLLTLPAAADTSGTLLTNSTAVCKAAVWTVYFGGTVLVAATSMTYSGTPGRFTYTVPATTLTRTTGALYVELSIYDATGTTLHYTAPMVLQPAA